MLRDVGIDIVGKQNHNIIVDIETSPSALIEWSDIVLWAFQLQLKQLLRKAKL